MSYGGPPGQPPNEYDFMHYNPQQNTWDPQPPQQLQLQPLQPLNWYHFVYWNPQQNTWSPQLQQQPQQASQLQQAPPGYVPLTGNIVAPGQGQ